MASVHLQVNGDGDKGPKRPKLKEVRLALLPMACFSDACFLLSCAAALLDDCFSAK